MVDLVEAGELELDQNQVYFSKQTLEVLVDRAISEMTDLVEVFGVFERVLICHKIQPVGRKTVDKSMFQ